MNRNYNGSLGRFSYQDDTFCLQVDEDGKEYLKYIGVETDGSKIQIPDGIGDATGMFQDSAIFSQPIIPDSVSVADCMFAGCENLRQTGDMPKRLFHADYMYACCPMLETVHAFPDALVSAQGMFDGCAALKEVPALPDGIKNVNYMFFGCTNLESEPVLPEGIDRNMVFSEESVIQMDDLSDIPDTRSFPKQSSIGRLFSEAEAQADGAVFGNNIVSQENKQMSQEERDAMLSVLQVEGLETSVSEQLDL